MTALPRPTTFADPDRRARAVAARVPAAETLAVWLAEVVHLTRVHGHATVDLWCREIRPDLPRASAERHWERVKAMIREARVPHRAVLVSVQRDAGNGVGRQHQVSVAIEILIGPADVDAYAQAIVRSWAEGRRQRAAERRAAVRAVEPAEACA